MAVSRLVLVDSVAHTAAMLAAELEFRGFGAVTVVPDSSELAALLPAGAPDVVIINHRYDEADGLRACSTVKNLAPQCGTVVVVAPGPALLAVQSWASQSRCVDAIAEKPIVDERFYLMLSEELALRAAARQVRSLADRLANLVPAGALSALGDATDPRAELFDAVILFTDIRDSSRLITHLPPREFFTRLNEVLSAQSARIRAAEGSIVKYTGDGVLAIFRGMGRSYLALRCGLDLAAMSRQQSLPYGVGIAQGLVLAGFIGDAMEAGERRQFDVIGATVHLAARLCAMASPGHVVVTRTMNAVAQIQTPAPRSIGNVSVRGFDHKVDCLEFSPDGDQLELL